MSTRVWTILSVGVFTAVLLWLLLADGPNPENLPTPSTEFPVSVVKVKPGSTHVTYQTTGITMPRWLTEVAAAVDGRVEILPTPIEPGSLLPEGKTLVHLMDIFYRAELAAAQARLAASELELSQAKREQSIVKKDAVTAFGRREPHIKAAKANLNAAQAALASARQRLQDTVITAPFPAIVIKRLVSPGQWVSTGDQLFQLAASDSVDIEVQLAASVWDRLGDMTTGINATVTTPSGKNWSADLRYLSPVMDPATRQRSLLLKVKNPYQSKPPLLPDQQVNVSFQGQEMSNVVSAPATVLTEDGKVWTVQQNKLHLESVELLDEQPESVSFRFADQPGHERLLVRYPLGIMLEGQAVSPDHVNDQ